MTSHSDFDGRCPSDASWILVNIEPYSKNREPQFKDCNQSSTETGAAISGEPAHELLENYDAATHYANSLESGNTDATARPPGNEEAAPAPVPVQGATEQPAAAPAVAAVAVDNLGPYLLQLPQHTFKDIQNWAAGQGDLFLSTPPPQHSLAAEHGSAAGTSSVSHSRAGVAMMDPTDVAVLGAGMWSGPLADMYASMTISNTTESSYYAAGFH